MSVHSSNEIPPLLLLAGGLATRLGTLTERLPKSLLKVAGEPFIAHQLRLLAEQGICDIVLSCGHLGNQIESFVGDGTRFGCNVRYSFDGCHPLGTGGAIRKALPLLGLCFWVMYGDSYLTVPLAAVLDAFRSCGRPALMVVHANANRWDRSNVLFKDGKVLGYDKTGTTPGMQHIDYGLGLYAAEVFHSWSDGSSFDLAVVHRALVERGMMAGYLVTERFYEIGSLTGLRETDSFLSERLRGVPA
jgi:NDP-sugar pyrophosphorylase family protein